MSPLALITIGALYLLGIMYFVGQGGFRRALATGAPDEIELLALRRREERGAAKGSQVGGREAAELGKAESESETDRPREREEEDRAPREDSLRPEASESLHGEDAAPAPDAHGAEATYRDRFSKQMAAVRESFGLSAREAEVAELIARGNTVAHIAELLFVSENTVRTHSKRIYVKLDIHKRQELIELVESFDPESR